MIKRDTEAKMALLLQRVFLSPINDKMPNHILQAMVRPLIDQQHGTHRPMQLRECGEQREVVLYAESGFAVMGQPNDSLKAVYVAKGLFAKTDENMSRIRSRGTIDFEGRLQIAFMTELAVAQIDERTGELEMIENSPPSEPVRVNRIDGEQSDLFSRIDQVLVFCGAESGAASDNRGQLQFENLTRVEVSTRNEMEPIRYQDHAIESAVTLGEGVLVWPSHERHTDRYGFITLSRSPDPGSGDVSLDIDGACGKDGALLCQILETRESPYADHFRGFIAQAPEIGEIIELGKGAFRVTDDNAIGLEPDDGREIDWLNPKALYRCHLQTVRLLFLPSS